jgi:hypothetical protein
MACPFLPLIRTPVPGPGFAPNSTLIRPLVGHAHFGDGWSGIFGKGFGAGFDVRAVDRVEPLGGVRRSVCPG